MSDSKTIQDYYRLVNQDFNELDDNDRFFCCNPEIFLASSILQEFGETSTRKIGKILLAACET